MLVPWFCLFWEEGFLVLNRSFICGCLNESLVPIDKDVDDCFVFGLVGGESRGGEH